MRTLKKLIFATMCLMIISGGSLLYAATGKSDIAVYLNNVLLKNSGLLSEGVPYLPAEQLPESLHAVVSWDESAQEVRIYKPNVNMVLLDDQGKIFGKVRSAASNTFSVLVQVDHLKTDISDLKITITDPLNKTDVVDNQQIKEKKDSFWFKSANYSYTFNEKGNYMIQVYIKDSSSKSWFIVSEMQISTI
ncbi:hypothetical protein [Paenibacillus jilunlii]|uniref:Copper amine oxidase N-terminal domain-containing protein n=1 Tax=Paenibacillus jilunlii TaxID=682956 RepID=A0A1G9T210_9BACL|nr:hypothetical protein [Paenibacillus jilunlii]KWX80120.1 hypothetical protein AML91_01395 [Paenibacillus jilunlii]SDM41647.1 hypothetical protein SAMN05216191_112160 [Paenibacillus jilunlii]